MQRDTYEITLADDGGRPVAPENGGHLLLGVTPAVTSVALMAIQGRGVARGRRPAWLRAVSDVRFMGARVNGGATFAFDAPHLGDAAADLFHQRDFWLAEPTPQDTGFDLLADAIQDIQHEKQDSNRFDRAVLQRIRNFRRVFSDSVNSISLAGGHIQEPVTFDPATLEHVQKLERSTPPEQRIRLAGELDMLRSSTSTFELVLDTGDRVKGVYDGDITELSDKLRRRVVVSGRAIFRPSGKLLRVDAEQMTGDPSAPTLWSRVPTPQRGKLERDGLLRTQGPSSGVAAILDQWPGDEDEDEVARQLERLS
jgi:hypothetical protein